MLEVASVQLFCAAWVSDGGHPEDWRLPVAAARCALAGHAMLNSTVRAVVNFATASEHSRHGDALSGAGVYLGEEVTDGMLGERAPALDRGRRGPAGDPAA